VLFELDKSIVRSLVNDDVLEERIFELALQGKRKYPMTAQASLLAASTFVVCKLEGIRVNQADMTRLFGVNNVSIRRDIQRILKMI